MVVILESAEMATPQGDMDTGRPMVSSLHSTSTDRAPHEVAARARAARPMPAARRALRSLDTAPVEEEDKEKDDEDDDDVTPIPAPPTSSTLSDGLMLPSKSLSLFVLLPTNIIDDVAVVVVDDDDDDNDATSAARDFAAA